MFWVNLNINKKLSLHAVCLADQISPDSLQKGIFIVIPSPIIVNKDGPCRTHREDFILPSAVSIANYTLCNQFAIAIDFCQKEKV